jgi:hypothetical protein
VAVLDDVARAPAILVGCSLGGARWRSTRRSPTRARRGTRAGRARDRRRAGAHVGSRADPAMIDRMERADEANDVDAINALEAHAWLDGPLEPEGRVGGPARTAVPRDERHLRCARKCAGEQHKEPEAYTRVAGNRMPDARRVG